MIEKIKAKLPPLPSRRISINKVPPFFCEKAGIHPRIDSLEKQNNSIRLSRRIKSTKSIQSRASSRDSSVQSSRRSIQKYHRVYNSKSMKEGMENLPKVTAKSWAVYEMRQNKYVYGKRNFKKREIASLTKIINLVTILDSLDEWGLQPEKIRVRATKEASSIIGTTAEIVCGRQYCLQDLFYGMMLPSGNDAAFLIAQIGGAINQMLSKKINVRMSYDIDFLDNFIRQKATNPVTEYLQLMNKKARKISMTLSNFANPHGLSNISTCSCVEDLSKLCIYAMRNSKFKNVVNTKLYEYGIYENSLLQEQKENLGKSEISISNKKPKLIQKCWKNTNLMLGEGWSGIKTGITPNAGPCLAASVSSNVNGKEYEILVILLSSQSMQARWGEVRQLANWVIQNNLL